MLPRSSLADATPPVKEIDNISISITVSLALLLFLPSGP